MRITIKYECLYLTTCLSHSVGVLHERSGETVSLEHAELLHLFIRNVEELLFLLFRRKPDRYVQKSRTPTFATYPKPHLFQIHKHPCSLSVVMVEKETMSCVETGNLPHFLIGQLEVEDIEVLLHTLHMG